ncbi:hypothetical protein GLYMA_10G083000v4 [Glycine max]|uniref:Uncharacterized protein n=2 Tax=Glycine subgen. Soja TaxID=1462606 RepID=A0A0R0HQT8_SOYBN|nr:hypothetical protein GYH30_027362 [Glycine max]KRH32871.1 hypothetical protein GLYMA_10G083000v4 [Glycine max]RZB86287.1 hypothetical protein D0Y65_026377 [Glycine soja]
MQSMVKISGDYGGHAYTEKKIECVDLLFLHFLRCFTGIIDTIHGQVQPPAVRLFIFKETLLLYHLPSVMSCPPCGLIFLTRKSSPFRQMA